MENYLKWLDEHREFGRMNVAAVTAEEAQELSDERQRLFAGIERETRQRGTGSGEQRNDDQQTISFHSGNISRVERVIPIH